MKGQSASGEAPKRGSTWLTCEHSAGEGGRRPCWETRGPGQGVRDSGHQGHLPEEGALPGSCLTYWAWEENCGLTDGCLQPYQASSQECRPCFQHPVCVKPLLSVAFAMISKPRQTQSDPCLCGTYHLAAPSSTVTTTNVSRLPNVPWGREQNCLWPSGH